MIVQQSTFFYVSKTAVKISSVVLENNIRSATRQSAHFREYRLQVQIFDQFNSSHIVLIHLRSVR